MLTFLLWLAACKQPEVECSETIACDLGAACVNGKCESQSCSTSDQCGIGQYCASDRSCVTGCEADTDCRFGEYCDTALDTCAPAECTDTRIDCGFGEFCSPSGDCYEAAGYYCKDCEQDEDCGGGGNYCLSGYCGVECVADSDCPSGYDCLPIADVSGIVIGSVCYTYCWLYE